MVCSNEVLSIFDGSIIFCTKAVFKRLLKNNNLNHHLLVHERNKMLESMPSRSDLIDLLGQPLFDVWQALRSTIDENYDMERTWNTGGKNWTYEYKYRRGGKTLCSLYAKRGCVGFMVIFGKDERAKFEEIRSALSDSVCQQYDEAKTYRDGKWVMFEPTNTAEFDDFMKLLAIKRKPNRK